MAGRATPGTQPSLASAVATVPPVDPADTIAAARPLATRPQATAALVPGSDRSPTPLSPIGMTSGACTTSTSGPAPCRRSRSSSGSA